MFHWSAIDVRRCTSAHWFDIAVSFHSRVSHHLFFLALVCMHIGGVAPWFQPRCIAASIHFAFGFVPGVLLWKPPMVTRHGSLSIGTFPMDVDPGRALIGRNTHWRRRWDASVGEPRRRSSASEGRRRKWEEMARKTKMGLRWVGMAMAVVGAYAMMGMPEQKKPKAVKTDVQYIRCGVCEEMTRNIYRSVKAMRDELRPGKKVSARIQAP